MLGSQVSIIWYVFLKKIGAFSASLRLVIVGFVMLMVTSVVEVVVSA